MITFTEQSLDDRAVINSARLITSAMLFAVLAAEEENPSERHALEQHALSLLRRAHREEHR